MGLRSVRGLRHQALAKSDQNRLCPIVYAELPVDAADMVPKGIAADAEPLGDRLVPVVTGQCEENLELAGAKLGQRRAGTRLRFAGCRAEHRDKAFPAAAERCRRVAEIDGCRVLRN